MRLGEHWAVLEGDPNRVLFLWCPFKTTKKKGILKKTSPMRAWAIFACWASKRNGTNKGKPLWWGSPYCQTHSWTRALELQVISQAKDVHKTLDAVAKSVSAALRTMHLGAFGNVLFGEPLSLFVVFFSGERNSTRVMFT